MEQLKHRVRGVMAAVPPSQRAVIVAALAVMLVAGLMFFRWLSAPSYTLLYGGLDDKSLAKVIDELDSKGISYKIDNGGSQVLVPRSAVYELRASLASSGVSGSAAPEGYEVLDGQGLAVSDFRQRVDYQRALEGELAKTLMAMDGVDGATVRLALPEDPLFEEDRKPVTASVLVDSSGSVDQSQVEAMVFLVSSSVEGLEPGNVTVADAAGQVLSAPGDDAGGAVGNRNMRQTREYEAALTNDIQQMLTTAMGAQRAAVVVRAQLNFDETSTESETYDEDSQVVLREEKSKETLTGSGTGPSGVVGVDGGQLGDGAGNGVDYTKNDNVAEYGVDREVNRTVAAPGRIERLSVAIVLDEDTEGEGTVPPEQDVEDLVSAAVGLDAERGDTVAVSYLAFPKVEEAASGGPLTAVSGMVPQIIGALVLLAVAAALFLMARGRSKSKGMELAALKLAGPHVLPPSGEQRKSTASLILEKRAEETSRSDLMELVQRQPEEIAALLRNWLADRRR